jgi:hypothetical protein
VISYLIFSEHTHWITRQYLYKISLIYLIKQDYYTKPACSRMKTSYTDMIMTIWVWANVTGKLSWAVIYLWL